MGADCSAPDCSDSIGAPTVEELRPTEDQMRDQEVELLHRTRMRQQQEASSPGGRALGVHRMDLAQRESLSLVDHFSSLPDPIFDGSRASARRPSASKPISGSNGGRGCAVAGWSTPQPHKGGPGAGRPGSSGGHGLERDAMQIAAGRFAREGLEGLLYKPSHSHSKSAAHRPSRGPAATPDAHGTPRSKGMSIHNQASPQTEYSVRGNRSPTKPLRGREDAGDVRVTLTFEQGRGASGSPVRESQASDSEDESPLAHDILWSKRDAENWGKVGPRGALIRP